MSYQGPPPKARKCWAKEWCVCVFTCAWWGSHNPCPGKPEETMLSLKVGCLRSPRTVSWFPSNCAFLIVYSIMTLGARI